MRKRMAILVIGIGAVLSSRESGQSFSKEMGAESLPKRLEGGVGAKRGNRCARGIGSRRKKENDNGSEGLRGGGKRFRWVPCAQSRNRWNFSVDGFEPFSGGCRNGACTGEEVYRLKLFDKVEGGGEEKLRWMPVERLKLFSGEAVDVAERDFIASKLEFEGRTERGIELRLPLCRPVEGAESLSVTTGILCTSKAGSSPKGGNSRFRWA